MKKMTYRMFLRMHQLTVMSLHLKDLEDRIISLRTGSLIIYQLYLMDSRSKVRLLDAAKETEVIIMIVIKLIMIDNKDTNDYHVSAPNALNLPVSKSYFSIKVLRDKKSL